MTSLKLTTQSDSPVIATSLSDLMACNGQEFVTAAYYTLLNRAPDPEGMHYYSGRLRNGYSKIGVLKQLQQSAEGGVGGNLIGLVVAIKRYKQRQSYLFGWIFSWLYGGDRDSISERKLRIIEYHLIELRSVSDEKLSNFENQLVELRNDVSRQSSTIETSILKVLESIETLRTSAAINITPKETAELKPVTSAPYTVSILDTPIIFEAASPMEVIAQLKAVVMQSKEALHLSLHKRHMHIQNTQSPSK